MNAPFMDPETIEKKRRQARVRAAFMLWHRRIGIVAALFTVILAVTGIILSHAERFSLHKTNISPWLANALYSKTPALPPVGAKTSDGWLVWVDGNLYLGAQSLGERTEALQGVVETPSLVVVAGAKSLLLYTPDGQLVERLNAAVLPGAISRIGRLGDMGVILEASGGLYGFDADFIELVEYRTDADAVTWSAPTAALPQSVKSTALNLYGYSPVSQHRLVTDLHSGRSFGPIGPYIMDISAILLIILSITGLYMWWRQRSARLHHARMMPPVE